MKKLIKKVPDKICAMMSAVVNSLYERSVRKKLRNKSFSINQGIFKDYNYEFDSDDDFYAQQALDNARKKKKGSIPRFMLSTNDVQKDIIYKRMNDIRKLELHYHQDIRGGKSGKQVNNDQFNDIYYTFKKKFLKNITHG